MDLLKFWRSGSQITSLNWQTYDKSMQINESMFVGSGGWILKPTKLLGAKEDVVRRLVLVADIIGISSCKLLRNDIVVTERR
jgi:phosphatidylinositol phospholipase C delta